MIRRVTKTKQKKVIFNFLEKEDPYGGEIIENLAKYGDDLSAGYTIPMVRENSIDLSYTGFLTNVTEDASRKFRILKTNYDYQDSELPIDFDYQNFLVSIIN